MTRNPFENTKASYFEDDEIVDYWVSIKKNEKDFFSSIVDPDSPFPKRIIGGKGSGKTHILRYFSFNSQKLRAERKNITLLSQIKDDHYIGIYMVAKGLRVNRFSGRGYSQKEWNNMFFYYLNLQFIEKLLDKILQIFEFSLESDEVNLQKIKNAFFELADQKIKIDSIEDLYCFVKNERKKIDQQVAWLGVPNNKKKLEIVPILTPEDGLFNVVKNVMNSISDFRSVKVLYIVDEFENFTVDQQKFFNSLLRHPQAIDKIIIRLSGRLNSSKTLETYDDGEILLEDSEIKTLELESLMSNKFDEFIKALFLKRILKKSDIKIEVDFGKSFQKNKDHDENTLIDIMETNKGKKRNYLKHLENQLKKHSNYGEPEIRKIILTLTYEKDWFLEKVSVYNFYQFWNKKKELLDSSELVKKSRDTYLKDKTGKFKVLIEKHGGTLLYQLFRVYRRNLSYSGYKNIVYMSNNNPRIFLTILSNTFNICEYSDINMLSEKFIPSKIQDQALLETSEWFWNNFTDDVRDHRVVWAVIKLLEFFRLYRRTDKPSEKKLVAFSYSHGEVSKEVEGLIKNAVEHSLLIPTTSIGKDRNTGEFRRAYRVHPMLSPRWELPLVTGGTIPFKKEEIESLFLNDESKWNALVKRRENNLNAPFVRHESDIKKDLLDKQGNLFNGH